MVWQQVYNPTGNMFLSTLLASLPVLVMLVGLGFLHMKAHIAAGLGLLSATSLMLGEMRFAERLSHRLYF